MNKDNIYRIPFTLLALGMILWFGKAFLVPLAYALLIAMLLYPLSRFFEKKGMSRIFSVAIPLALLCLVFIGLLFLLSVEFSLLSAKWTALQEKIDPLLADLQSKLTHYFGWSAENQMLWLKAYLNQLSQHAGALLSNTAEIILGALINLLIIPVYAALILLYRNKWKQFLEELFPDGYEKSLIPVLQQSVGLFSKYIRGMALVYLLVGLLNALGLWIIGVEKPLLYGMITAVMTIIPYFGIVISALLPITFSWLETGSLLQPLLIIGVFTLVQYLEANLIFPYVVGRFVKLNTLAALLAIFLGAFFWGVAGMILFLPFLAVFRHFAEQHPALKAWAKVLG